ncbi:hypothetical protein BCV71DRAFT_276234 [Rhizopus microsporus]|uniref:Uncharacterized protein n=1 Tax=Rhizopus microsporus TaxID=58291 RepID=A0A1X0RR17_RHIZD|nr:hypothetical protein BCV71DRAFT_276234 [Rhizopus microsporus]
MFFFSLLHRLKHFSSRSCTIYYHVSCFQQRCLQSRSNHMAETVGQLLIAKTSKTILLLIFLDK